MATTRNAVFGRVLFPGRSDYLGISPRRFRRLPLLNRFDPSQPSNGEAEVKYLDGDFRVVRPGSFVRCAVTGAPIAIDELKYWSVDRQEAYATPEAVLERYHDAPKP
jgi:hypothetical protein